MNQDDKSMELIRRPASKTAKGDLLWKEAFQKEVFEVSFPEYSLTIESFYDRDRGESYQLGIFNYEGRDIDTINPARFSSDELSNEAHDLLKKIFSEAKRGALGLDDALDDLIELLGDESPLSTHVGAE